jgi:hypothetical protein
MYNIIVILGKMFKKPYILTHMVSNIWEQCISQVLKTPKPQILVVF